MLGLSVSEQITTLAFFVLIQCQSVTYVLNGQRGTRYDEMVSVCRSRGSLEVTSEVTSVTPLLFGDHWQLITHNWSWSHTLRSWFVAALGGLGVVNSKLIG